MSDVTVTEGNGSAVSAVFTVSLSSASGKTVNVDHATADGTATAPADYAAGAGSLTFTPGQTSKTVTVIVAGDSLDEIDETFNLNLSNAVNAAIADGSGLGTILDNDALPIVNVNDVTVTESDSGTVDATFTVSLNTPSGRALSVDYATANNTATAPADYTAVERQPQLRSGRDEPRRSPCRSTGICSTRSTRRTSSTSPTPRM